MSPNPEQHIQSNPNLRDSLETVNVNGSLVLNHRWSAIAHKADGPATHGDRPSMQFGAAGHRLLPSLQVVNPDGNQGKTIVGLEVVGVPN